MNLTYRSKLSDQVLIDFLNLDGVLLDGLDRPNVGAQLGNQVGVLHDHRDLFAKIRDIPNLEEQAVDPILNQLGHAADVGGDDGRLGEERLVNGQGGILMPDRGNNQDIDLGHDIGYLAVLVLSQESNPFIPDQPRQQIGIILEPAIREKAPIDLQLGLAASNPVKCFDKYMGTLGGNKGSDIPEPYPIGFPFFESGEVGDLMAVLREQDLPRRDPILHELRTQKLGRGHEEVNQRAYLVDMPGSLMNLVDRSPLAHEEQFGLEQI